MNYKKVHSSKINTVTVTELAELNEGQNRYKRLPLFRQRQELLADLVAKGVVTLENGTYTIPC